MPADARRAGFSFQVANTLASVGAAWGLGLTREAIRSGLESFAADMEHVPGRFNLLDVHGVTVVVDYGHNPSSLVALIEALNQFPHKRRTALYTCAGDRRDCDMIRQGELLGEAFDRVILYEDHYVRGRQSGEIMGLLRGGVFGSGLTNGRRAAEVQEVCGAVPAIESALATVRPGELLLIQADTIDETVDYLRRYLAAHSDVREIDLREVLANGRPQQPPQPVHAESPAPAVVLAVR